MRFLFSPQKIYVGPDVTSLRFVRVLLAVKRGLLGGMFAIFIYLAALARQLPVKYRVEMWIIWRIFLSYKRFCSGGYPGNRVHMTGYNWRTSTTLAVFSSTIFWGVLLVGMTH